MAKAYLERVGDVAELVICAPPLNLFDQQLAADLESALAGPPSRVAYGPGLFS